MMKRRAQPDLKNRRPSRLSGERPRARKRRGWPEQWIDHLGKISDSEIARRAGVSADIVMLERQRRGIQPSQPHAAPVDWTPEKIALLGTVSDSRIARMLGICSDVVSRKRRRLGIPPFHPPQRNRNNPTYAWTPEGLALLGQQSDRRVAEQLGISTNLVQRKRQELEILPFRPARQFQWTAERLEQLGKEYDRVLAERFGICPGTVYRKRFVLGIPPRRLTRSRRQPVENARAGSSVSVAEREIPPPAAPLERTPARQRFEWPEKLVALLGRISDKALARRAGISIVTVAAERQRRGIEACYAKQDTIQWTPEMMDRLGTAYDREVAEELGIPVSCVGRKRRLLGIPSFHPVPRVGARIAKWTPKNLALLGKMTDKELARRMRISATTVNTKRQVLGIPPFRPPARRVAWSEEMLALLGKVYDSVVARRYGISDSKVFRKRRELGIPAYLNTLSVVRTPEVVALLHLPTREVELQTGLHRSTIVRLRKELGIRVGLPSSRPPSRRSPRRKGSR